jgi:hypothetical protein
MTLTLNFTLNRRFAVRFFALYALLNLIVFSVACSTSWIMEAEAIIGALIPAAQGILVIVSGLGAAISPTAIASIQSWGTQAQNDLQNVVLPLIQQYNTAEAGAQPGILTQIEAVLATITGNLAAVLPALHVDNAATQAKIEAIVTEISDEFQALINLIPVIKGTPAPATPASVMKALAAHPEAVNKLKSAKQFRKDFNQKAGEFGAQYSGWIK